MQFIKYTAQIERINHLSHLETLPFEEQMSLLDTRKILIERIGDMSYEGSSKSNYCFVYGTNSQRLNIGIICVDTSALQKDIKDFISGLDIEITELGSQETTYNEIRHMLSRACSRGFIHSEDEIYARFNFPPVTRFLERGFDWDEYIVAPRSRQIIEKDAVKISLGEDFLDEIERIYAGGKSTKIVGHPVHYMMQTGSQPVMMIATDDLLAALHANGRLQNMRCGTIDFDIETDSFSPLFYTGVYDLSCGGALIINLESIADEDEGDYARINRDVIMKICEIARAYHNDVLTIFSLPIECTQLKEVLFSYLEDMTIVEIKSDLIYDDNARDYLKNLASEAHIRSDKNLMQKIEDGMGYHISDLKEIFDHWFSSKLKTSIYPQYKNLSAVSKKELEAKPKGSAYTELMEMIGLTEVKRIINEALDYAKSKKLCADKGVTLPFVPLHMSFTGNPGTAKTSVARLFARILRENGILSTGHLIEVGRADIVGKYVGWTAKNVKKIFEKARGNVLFIDEAYSLVDDRNGSFGDEAIATIVQEMENHREDVVVIFAGYPDKMKDFVEKNAGLRSRINFHVPFSDYSPSELSDIARLMLKKYDMRFDDEADRKLADIFKQARLTPDFGNGRYVRNVIEMAQMKHGSRLVHLDPARLTRDDVRTITADDIEKPIQSSVAQKPVRKLGFCG